MDLAATHGALRTTPPLNKFRHWCNSRDSANNPSK